MSDFVYTNCLNTPESSFVDEVCYNNKRRALAVSLDGQWYVYKGVPVHEYERFVDADERGQSVGRVYRDVKANYGPGEFIGFSHEVDINPDITAVEGDTETTEALVGAYNLTYTPQNTTSAPTTISLSVSSVPADVQVRNHVVSFVVGDDEVVRTWATPAGSVREAAEALESLGASLDLDFHVKGVYVSFE